MTDFIPLSDKIFSVVGVAETYIPAGSSKIVLDVEVVGFRVRGGNCKAVTFVDADVAPATDLITKANHGYLNGMGPVYVSNAGGALPVGLSANTGYYIGKVNDNQFVFTDTWQKAVDYARLNPTAQAEPGRRIDITSCAGGGTHSIGGMPAIAGASQTSGNGSIILNAVGKEAFYSPSGLTVKGTVAGAILNYWYA